MGLIVYKVVDGAWPSIEQFGISFIWDRPGTRHERVYGALAFIYGTRCTSFVALLFAGAVVDRHRPLPERAAPAAVRGLSGRWSRCSRRSRAS